MNRLPFKNVGFLADMAALSSGVGLSFLDTDAPGRFILGSGERPRKGQPPNKPTKHRAKVKAARKARHRNRS